MTNERDLKTDTQLLQMIADARARYESMSPDEKARHDYEQRRSFVRGMCRMSATPEEKAAYAAAVDRLLPPLSSERLRPQTDGKMREALQNLYDAGWAVSAPAVESENTIVRVSVKTKDMKRFNERLYEAKEALATPAPSPIAKEPHEILGDQRIGVELQSIPDNGYGASPIDAAGMRKLIHAAREFVRKVESGEARSKQSYGEFKAALHEIDSATTPAPEIDRDALIFKLKDAGCLSSDMTFVHASVTRVLDSIIGGRHVS